MAKKTAEFETASITASSLYFHTEYKPLTFAAEATYRVELGASKIERFEYSNLDAAAAAREGLT